ncbi:MAG: SPOR domain-containing protein [Spirochaetaceae bacterium]|jgi:rare lipoprotein A|nr:SPOR domain-containing protein [Spirochaetaceae bacterium]
MYKKLAVQILVLLILIPAARVFAGGAKSPQLVVETPSETSRLISMDWSNVSNAQRYRWGLYRFDLEEKSFTLIDELAPLQSSYLDEELEPPLSKYYYKIERASQRASLEKTRPQRLNQDDVREQLASIFQAPAIPPPIIIEPPPSERPPLSSEITADLKTGEEYPYEDGDEETVVNAVFDTTPARNLLMNEGIYIGAIGFSGKVTDITHNPDGSPALVLLDGDGRQALLENLARGYKMANSSGTALYYADHKALVNLSEMRENGNLPGNIDSVTVITFTDGIDTSSTDISFAPLEGRRFKSASAYNNFVSQQLRDSALRLRLPGIKKFNAWSIGVPGKDVQNSDEFGWGLRAVGPDDYYEFTNLSQIERILSNIAEKLLITYKPRINLTLSTPAYPVGTRLRITFDGYAADVSDRYIDTRVGLDEESKSYTLIVTEQSGMRLASDNKLHIEGKRTETGIDYTMMLTDEFYEAQVKQWHIQPGEDAFGWLQNSEASTNKTADFTYERKSEIIYLVLDCSSSLSEKEIDNIRSALGVFINKLYNSLYDPSTRAGIDAFAKDSFRNVAQYTPGGKSANSSQDVYIQTYKPSDAAQLPRPASEIVIQTQKQEGTGTSASPPPPAAASTYRTQTSGQSGGTPAPSTPSAASSAYRTQTYGQSGGTSATTTPTAARSAYRTQTYGQSTGTSAPPPPPAVISTYQPQTSGQSAGTPTPSTPSAASSAYRTQTYGQSTGTSVPPPPPVVISTYQPQTSGQSAGSSTPPPAPPAAVSRLPQTTPYQPVSEIIVQAYRPSDATSRLPQATLPTIVTNSSRDSTAKPPAVQSRPANRSPAAVSSPNVPVIEVLSFSNAPLNTASRSGYWVQIGSYSDVSHAQRAWRLFSNAGMGSSEIFSTNMNGVTYYRVKAGPYASETDAERALAQMKNYSPLYNDSFITND